MFKRTLQIDVVKANKKQTPETENLETEKNDNLAIVLDGMNKVVKTIGLVVCTYVVMDTARQVVVESARQ